MFNVDYTWLSIYVNMIKFEAQGLKEIKDNLINLFSHLFTQPFLLH